ncbi:MAG: cellulase family glycosylhydrolase [Anaerolineae bacterium]
MRNVFYWAALLFVLAGCAATPSRGVATPGPNLVSSLFPKPTSTPVPLAATITPDSAPSFRAVAGRPPFTVTFNVTITGGAAPYQVAWDFQGMGKTDSADSAPRPVVYSAGEYTATVTVKDRAGATTRADRRIVVLGNPPALPNWKYGVTAQVDQRRAGYYPTLQDVAHAADLMAAAGVQAVRVDFGWDQLNPAPQQYQWQDYEAMVQALRARKLDVMGVLDYSSWWGSAAQSSDDWRVRLYSPPLDPRDFARYAYAVVSHFKNNVHVWQVWNQPNTSDFWKPLPDAARYVQLLQETYLAIKYADPQAVVVFGGLSGNGVEGDNASGWESNFIQSAYAAGARGYFDVMAIHPFILPNSGIAVVRNRITATRATLTANGDGKLPIWLTEMGVPTDAPWWPTAPLQSEASQAAWLAQVYTRLWDQTPTIFWYSLQDRAGEDDPDAHFGLLHADYSSKPAYDQLKGLTGGAGH